MNKCFHGKLSECNGGKLLRTVMFGARKEGGRR